MKMLCVLREKGTRAILQKNVQEFVVTGLLPRGRRAEFMIYSLTAAVTKRNTKYNLENPFPQGQPLKWWGFLWEDKYLLAHWRVNQGVRNGRSTPKSQTVSSFHWKWRQHKAEDRGVGVQGGSGGRRQTEVGVQSRQPSLCMVQGIGNKGEGGSSWQSLVKQWLKSHELPRT